MEQSRSLTKVSYISNLWQTNPKVSLFLSTVLHLDLCLLTKIGTLFRVENFFSSKRSTVVQKILNFLMKTDGKKQNYLIKVPYISNLNRQICKVSLFISTVCAFRHLFSKIPFLEQEIFFSLKFNISTKILFNFIQKTDGKKLNYLIKVPYISYL